METYDMLKVAFGELIKILGGVSKIRNSWRCHVLHWWAKQM